MKIPRGIIATHSPRQGFRQGRGVVCTHRDCLKHRELDPVGQLAKVLNLMLQRRILPAKIMGGGETQYHPTLCLKIGRQPRSSSLNYGVWPHPYDLARKEAGHNAAS